MVIFYTFVKKMNIQARKISFVQNFLNLKNESVLTQLETILLSENIELNQYNEELIEADSRIENGDFFTNSQVLNLVKEWK